MIKKDKIMHINIFDGDDGIKYIRYSDFEKMVDRIKQVHDEVEKEKDKEIERKNNIMKKAIEFIKTYTYRDDDGFYAIEDNSSQLITILECGVDKE